MGKRWPGSPDRRPRPTAAPATIPDGFTVWAVSDIHGQLGALEAGLAEAGLVDAAGEWAAPLTALAVLGDSIDRGPDSLGTLRRLDRLRGSAAQRGGLVTILEGNHEDAAIAALDGGDPSLLWLRIGGDATVASCTAHRSSGPELRRLLATLAPWARWRDVALVHAGLVPDTDLDEFTASPARLWRHGDFLWGPPFPGAHEWRYYRKAGIERVVVGHKRVASPTLEQDGRALLIDTGAGRDEGPEALTFVRLPHAGLADAMTVRIEVGLTLAR